MARSAGPPWRTSAAIFAMCGRCCCPLARHCAMACDCDHRVRPPVEGRSRPPWPPLRRVSGLALPSSRQPPARQPAPPCRPCGPAFAARPDVPPGRCPLATRVAPRGCHRASSRRGRTVGRCGLPGSGVARTRSCRATGPPLAVLRTCRWFRHGAPGDAPRSRASSAGSSSAIVRRWRARAGCLAACWTSLEPTGPSRRSWSARAAPHARRQCAPMICSRP